MLQNRFDFSELVLDAATETTVSELEAALNRIREPHTQTNSDGGGAGDMLCVDIDLSALPVSKRAEGVEKGYVAKQKNRYTRQLARVVVSETQEIVSHALYSGTTRSDAVFKTMVGKLGRVDELRDSYVYGNNLDKRQKRIRQLIITRRNSDELLQPVDKPFHFVPLFV